MLGKTKWYLVLFILCCVVLLPLFHSGFVITDDGNWMIIRLSAFYQSLREGQFPVRFLGRLNNSYGYPVSNFLYPGFLYIGSLIHFFGIPFILTIKLIIASSVVVGTLFIFLWLKKHVSKLAALLGSLSFLFSPYLLFDIYKRGSVGEILALSVTCIILYCIDSSYYFILSFLFALLVLSHNSLALVFIFFFALVLSFRRDRRGIISLILGIGMSTFFWFPALYEKKFVTFDNVSVSFPSQYFIVGPSLYLLGIIPFVAFILYLIYRPKKISRSYIIGYVVTLVLATPISQFLWTFNSFARLFQFPYRFLSGTIILGSYLVAKMIDVSSKKIRLFIVGLICFFASWLMISTLHTLSYNDFPEGYYTTNEATTTVANEYMPRWVAQITEERPTVRLAFQNGRGTIVLRKATTQRIDATVQASEDSILQINSIYYPGWGVIVDDTPAVILYNNPNGVIRFPVLKGSHHVVAEFRETVPRFSSDVISVIFLIVSILFVIYQKKGLTKIVPLIRTKSLSKKKK